MLKDTFPKGKTVKAIGIDWYGIVYEAPRKKTNLDGYATMGVEVFGFAHESGSVYVKEYQPCSVQEFNENVQGTRYFKGLLV